MRPVLNNYLAKKILTILAVLMISTSVSHAVTPVQTPPNEVEMAELVSGNTLVIYLKHGTGVGGTVSVALTSTYTSNFPGCGITASLNGAGDKIIIYLPDSGCTPAGSSQMECAVITAVDAAGVIVSEHLLVADSGVWEVLEGAI